MDHTRVPVVRSRLAGVAALERLCFTASWTEAMPEESQDLRCLPAHRDRSRQELNGGEGVRHLSSCEKGGRYT